MNEQLTTFNPDALDDHELVAQAIGRAVHDAVLRHARLGFPVASWRDGKVVWVQPAEIPAMFAEHPDASSPG